MPRTWAQAAGFLLGFAAALFLAPLEAPGEPVRTDALAELEAALFAAVNDLRAEHHLIPLERRPDLDRVARGHSVDMVRRGYLSHESPEGANPVDRITRGNVSGFSLAAENLGRTNRVDPTREIVRSWLASPDHRRNLLAPPFNATGIGIARASDGSLVYTQLYVTYPR